ncbi:MAG: hypothetical protein UX17_C0056G0007 [Parcubacteria group bacterium GW2011_GWC2_45_7]|nr:MAG: hypothetical protein UX17_C0056G0007 [Parcubacteria group bacterium GW2011_GWC2_45_7]KKU73695.1 MAG: hypothetical protein UX98_C0005G0071 [Parcubacteria group bacterium GW2011_GWA2_47_26]
MGREQVIAKLQARPWFKATSSSLRELLLELPWETCAGFLTDLAARPDELGGVRVIALADLLIPDTSPIFGIFAVFQVQVLKDLQLVYWYQYFSWRQGPESGSKGVVLVRRGGRITHIVVMRGDSFAVGGSTFDGIGGFAEPTEVGVTGMLNRFRTEIGEELGLPELRLEEVIPLGRMYPDRGMTNNHPHLFAAVISGDEAARLGEGEAPNPDPWEMRSGPVVVPVEALWGPQGFVMQNDDSYFGTCMARLVALGLLTPTVP